jgi:hypothetical protein
LSADGAQQRHAAARNDAFFHRGAGVHIVDAVLLFHDLGFGRSADADDGHAAGERFRQPLLQLPLS